MPGSWTVLRPNRPIARSTGSSSPRRATSSPTVPGRAGGSAARPASLFDDATDSSLSDPEIQLSVGFTARVSHSSFFQFSYTNNFINYDNTPDLVFHVGFSQFFD